MTKAIAIIIFFAFLNNANNKSDQKSHNDFIRESILENNVSFLCPIELTKLDDSDLKSEFPNKSQRPNCVFENKLNKIKFAVNYGSSNATDRDLTEIKLYLEKIYRRVAVDFIKSDYRFIGNKRFIVMQFELQDPLKLFLKKIKIN